MRFFNPLLIIATMGCADMGLSRFDSGVAGIPELGVAPEGDLQFGRVSPSIPKSALQELTLYSAGDATLAIVDVYLDDSSSGAYSVRSDLPLPLRLEPGREFPLEVRFVPFAVGTFAAELVVLFDDGTAEGESYRIPIKGEGCQDAEQTGTCSS
jgi:hypothetical protein